eukprot:1333094-Lingulodinium_polyedra.AAC.1
MCVEVSVDWRDEDTDVLRGPESFEGHLAYMMSDVRRQHEVNVRQRTVAQREGFNVAKIGSRSMGQQ